MSEGASALVEQRCACVADDRQCRNKAQVGDTLCRACRLHHTAPFGLNEPAGKGEQS